MISIEEALRIAREIREENGEAEKWLKEKSDSELKSRTEIIKKYGDPRALIQNK